MKRTYSSEDQYEKNLQWAREWKARNKERVKEMRKLYYKNNKEKERVMNEKWKEENPILCKELKSISDKKWREKNIEKIKAKRQTRKYKDAINKRAKNRYRTDVEYRLTAVLRACFLQALNLQKVKKSKSIKKLIGCSNLQFRLFLSKKFLEDMTWDNHGYGEDKWHIDHIKPCKSFDLSKEEEVKKCFHFTNLQPLWQKDNLTKHATYTGNESHINIYAELNEDGYLFYRPEYYI